MAFTDNILSWRFRHLNIVGCLLKRRPTKWGSRAPQDPPLATPLCEHCKRTNRSTISLFFYINDLEVSIYLFWHLRVGGREVMETG